MITTPAKALEGLRILDVTQVMAGPFCTMLLCDMGADVIKIEPPAGDSSRRMAGAIGSDSPSFNAVNRGKRGLILNLKSSAGQEVFRHLTKTADILVENFRPTVMSTFGLDYANLATIQPRLIYASISGYGQTGPDSRRGGFDLIAQGVAGIMSVTGNPDSDPVKAGVPLTDLGAALFAVSGILAALHYRHSSGRGQHIDTSLVDAGVALSVWEATEYFSSGQIPTPLGSAHRMSAPYQAIQCADGFITLGAANDRLFNRLCNVLEHPEWLEQPNYASDTARVKNRLALATAIEAITSKRPCQHWLELFEQNEIPCGPINDYAEVARDPHLRSREMIVETDHPTFGKIKTLGSPIKFSETPTQPNRPAPLLGEHTNEVLREHGYNAKQIAKLQRDGVLG
ncbi:MAG TPA: CoA transferase [Acidobacteria bacterium]|nr:CoA transferase [Acidobacteriota bacterium]|tara:strand:+ start:2891 stop:4087 length:1197 start_codon:yes stop_codon:yes gene_type:complete